MTKTRKNVEGLSSDITIETNLSNLRPASDNDEIPNDISGVKV